MHLLVGLGNPGRQYEKTRHNVGFQVIDRFPGHHIDSSAAHHFLRSLSAGAEREKFQSLWREHRWGATHVLTVKPQTYMNLSGQAVQKWIAYYKIPLDHVLIVHDDLDLPLGRMKFAHGGGSGGHKGVDSIIRELGTKAFLRLKVGIGRPRYSEPVEEFVLNSFYSDETDQAGEAVEKAVMAVETWIREGISKAMNAFN